MKRHKKHRPGYNWHHRKPRSQNGNSSPKNMVEVEVQKHKYWTMLFDGTRTAQDICSEISNTWLDPAYKFICVSEEHYEKVQRFCSKLT